MEVTRRPARGETRFAKLDVRVRLLGRLIRRSSSKDISDEQLVAAQEREIPRNAITDLLLGRGAPGTSVRADSVRGDRPRTGIRVYRPLGDGSRLPLVVNIHGGGFTTGAATQADWLASHVALQVPAAVVSIQYRLSPRHRWPTAAEDCYAGLVEVVGRAEEFGADASRVAVIGDSAGGNLAAVTALMARDRSGPGLAFQGLIYPVTDFVELSPSALTNAHAPIFDLAALKAMRRHYLAGQDPSNPYVSPLRAEDVAGVPRALVQVAEYDPLRDEGIGYAEKLRAAGVPVRTTEYVGMPHGFLSFPRLCRSAPQALAELVSELRDALALGESPR